MNKYIKTLAFAALSSFALVSCSDNWEPADVTGTGHVAFKGIDVVNATSSRASADVSKFIVTVKDDAGAIVNQWKYAEMPEIISMPVGTNYTAEVISHVQEKAAWDAPFYKGVSEKFNIVNNEITEVNPIICKLSNIKVSIKYSDALKAVMGDDCKVTVIANDEGRLVYDKNETRAGYFEAIEGSTTLIATLTGTINGNQEEIVRIFTDVEAGQHRVITYSIKQGDSTIPDETGYVDPSSGISIDMSTIDESVDGNVNPGEEDTISGDRPGHEDPEQGKDPVNPDNPDDPSQDDAKINVVASWTSDLDAEAVPVDGETYLVTIDSDKPLTNLIVKIISESLTDEMLTGVGLGATFDLAHPGDLKDALSGSFGFPVEDEVIGQTHVEFDITPFVPLLNIYPDELHQFELTIKAEDGLARTVTLNFRT